MSKQDSKTDADVDPIVAPLAPNPKYLSREEYDSLPETSPDIAAFNPFYETSGKYPRCAYYLSEAVHELCANIYLADFMRMGNAAYTYFYLGDNWNPLKIILTPSELDEDAKVIDETFDPDLHERMEQFMIDLDAVSDNLDVKIFHDDGDAFSIEARTPKDLLKLIENFVEEYDVPVKDFAGIRVADDNNEEYDPCLSDRSDALLSEFNKNVKEGNALYDQYAKLADAGLEERHVLLRYTANRPFNSLDHLAAITNITCQYKMKSSIGELRAVVAEETKTSFAHIRGYNLSN